jgi:hypothetical protein
MLVFFSVCTIQIFVVVLKSRLSEEEEENSNAEIEL